MRAYWLAKDEWYWHECRDTTKLLDRPAGGNLAQDVDDLRLGEATLAHA